MLTQLFLENLAIVKGHRLELSPGLTVITGETGAGKSLLLDGLGLIMGQRADSSLVTEGKKRAEVTALFDLTQLPTALSWLLERELEDTENPTLLNVRRTLSNDGRSKAYINGKPATLADLKTLAERLISIQGQHAQYDLLNSEKQLSLLDAFGQHGDLKQTVKNAWHSLQSARRELAHHREQVEAGTARKALLQYQVTELEQAELANGEFTQLEARLKALSSADERAALLGELSFTVRDQENACLQQIAQLTRKLSQYSEPDYENLHRLLTEAQINLEEAASESNLMVERVEASPEALSETNSRMEFLNDLARKHRVEPDQLFAHWNDLARELAELDVSASRLPELENACEKAQHVVTQACEKLSEARAQAADELSQAVTAQLAELELAEAQFSIALEPTDPSPSGAEKVAFELSANQGGRKGPLSKVASGGELSRVALGIQVCVASRLETPTLIFDEVDVGIGGRTASKVGSLLRTLGSQAQVMVVTHQPQVAGQGQTHWHLSKQSLDGQTISQVDRLDAADRVEELARMLAGEEVTEATRANARELLRQDA